MLTKSEFLKPSELSGPFTVEGLGDVFIRKVPCSEAVALEQAGGGGLGKVIKLIIATVVSAERDAVFTAEDFDAIQSADVDTLDPLVDLVKEHSGYFAEGVDEAVEKSEAITPKDSGTG